MHPSIAPLSLLFLLINIELVILSIAPCKAFCNTMACLSLTHIFSSFQATRALKGGTKDDIFKVKGTMKEVAKES